MPVQENDAKISPDGLYRYTLHRRVEGTQGDPFHVLWVMVNPSTAGATTDDATIRKVMGYCKKWGATHFHVVNLYAYRARDIKVLSTVDDPVGPENDVHISLQAGYADQVICAWGAREKLRGVKGVDERIDYVMRIIRSSTFKKGRPIYCIGKTAGGDPLHPLTTSYLLARQEFGR
jgi:hypothetical protein